MEALLIKTQRPWLNIRSQLFVILFLFCMADFMRQYQAFDTKSPEVYFTNNRENNETEHSITSNDGICGVLGNQSPTSLWAKNVLSILRASQSPLDTNYVFQNPTAQVLKIITPRLHNSMKSSPRNWKAMEHVIETTNRRLAYLKAKREGRLAEEVRPLKILVMGGSVTRGMNCYTRIRHYDYNKCCWATRLGTLLNSLAGDRVVDVHLAAVSATNSATGQVMLEYSLLPEEMRGPDIIISAYSTNDMHVYTMQEALSQNITLRDKIFGMAQNFTRTALQQCTKEGNTPLLFWLDDYLGNEQREIVATSDFIQGLQVLAGYYGFGLLSYADTVRDLVYGSTTERSFSPPGWYKENSEMKREVHPPYPMHIAVSYIIAYAFLQLTSTYCGLESWNVTSWESRLDYYNAEVPGLPNTQGSKESLDMPPQPRPEGLPPSLNTKLKLEDISELWREVRPNTCDAEKTHRTRCPIGWVGALRPDHTADDVSSYFQPYIRQPFEWEWTMDRKKPGWLPTSAENATMTFDFPLQQEIHRLVIFYMKSYGEMWENSKAELKIYLDDDTVDEHAFQFSLGGFHDKKTSEVYVEEVDLPRGALRRLQMKVQHAAGKSFKLMGFAICS